MLKSTVMIYVSGVLIMREKDKIRLLLAKDSQQELSNDLKQVSKQETVITILGDINMKADSHLVYLPGAKGQAISLPGGTGERLGGTFITFFQGLLDEDCVLVEDGWVLKVKKSQLDAIVAAVDKCENLTIGKAGDECWFGLEWYNRDFVNPVNQTVIRADWMTYGTQGNTKNRGEEKAETKKEAGTYLRAVTLLTAENLMERCLSAKALTSIIQQLDELMLEFRKKWITSFSGIETEKATKGIQEDQQQKQQRTNEEKLKKEKGTVVEGQQNEGQTKKPVNVLGQGKELVVQVELDINRQVKFAASIAALPNDEVAKRKEQTQGDNVVVADRETKAQEFKAFILTSLHQHFASSNAELPVLSQGPISFLLHFVD